MLLILCVQEGPGGRGHSEGWASLVDGDYRNDLHSAYDLRLSHQKIFQISHFLRKFRNYIEA